MKKSTLSRLARLQIQQIAFLLILPAANWLLVVAALHDLGVVSWTIIGQAMLRIWLLFALSYLVLRLAQRYAGALICEQSFWRQLILHIVVVLSISAIITQVFGQPNVVTPAPNMAIMRVFLMLEIIVYVAVRWVAQQQAFNSAITNRLKEAQLHALRSQSNPHFLFNTLNLISAEIESDPSRAKETVYDLADLLRSNVRLAERDTISVREEMRLLSLYLGLQQRRFEDRLSVSVTVDQRTANLEVPALLLQPVIENTVKWAVAPHAAAATISVSTELRGDRWSVTIKDSGPPFDDTAIAEGDGFRILYQTLELHYNSDYKASLRSTSKGGVFSLDLPVTVKGHANG